MIEEKRPLHRQIKCCGNCWYFSYYRGKQRRGVCWNGKKKPRPFYSKDLYKTLPPTHVTCVCDNHKFKSRKSLEGVEDWCGAVYIEDI
jgi:hypothetical protein